MSTAKASSDQRQANEHSPSNSADDSQTPSRLHRAVALLRFVLGIVFVVLGIVGSLLPVMQGWIFFLLALVMFFPDDPRVEKVLQKAAPRFPRLVTFLRRMGVGNQDTTRLAKLEVGHHHPGGEAGPDGSDRTAD